MLRTKVYYEKDFAVVEYQGICFADEKKDIIDFIRCTHNEVKTINFKCVGYEVKK